MRRRGKLTLPAACATLATAAGLVLWGPGTAQAHDAGGDTHPATAAHDHHAGRSWHRGHAWHPGHSHAPGHHHHHHHHGHHHGHHSKPPTDPTDPPPTDPGEPMACMALYNVTEEHSGGFTGQVEVMNHATRPMEGWTVTWQPGVDTTITAVQDGTLTQNGDGTVTVRNAASNATIPPDGEVFFGFTADSVGNNFPIGSMGCTSP